MKSDNCTKSKWFFYIKRIVDEIGFSYIWINQVNERNCKQSIAKTFLQRLKDIYSQNSLRYINKDENTDSGKMQFLRKIKDNYAFEPYLNIQNSHHRKSISQIRLSSHRLAIETGRWQNILRENSKYCTLNKIETENHLFECDNYIEGRNHMHNFIKEKMDLNFYNSAGSSQLQKLKYLFKYGELSSLNSLGKYIFESFKSRDKQS